MTLPYQISFDLEVIHEKGLFMYRTVPADQRGPRPKLSANTAIARNASHFTANRASSSVVTIERLSHKDQRLPR